MRCYLSLKQISDRTLQPRFCVHRIPVGQTLSPVSRSSSRPGQPEVLVSPSPSITLQRLSIFFAFSCRVANVLACDRNKKSSEIPTLAPPVREQKEGVGSCEQVGSEQSTKRSTETFRGSNIYVTTQNGCHRHKGIQQFSLNQFEDVLAEGLEENNR